MVFINLLAAREYGAGYYNYTSVWMSLVSAEYSKRCCFQRFSSSSAGAVPSNRQISVTGYATPEFAVR
jgi:hypothetical protein